MNESINIYICTYMVHAMQEQCICMFFFPSTLRMNPVVRSSREGLRMGFRIDSCQTGCYANCFGSLTLRQTRRSRSFGRTSLHRAMTTGLLAFVSRIRKLCVLSSIRFLNAGRSKGARDSVRHIANWRKTCTPSLGILCYTFA